MIAALLVVGPLLAGTTAIIALLAGASFSSAFLVYLVTGLAGTLLISLTRLLRPCTERIPQQSTSSVASR